MDIYSYWLMEKAAEEMEKEAAWYDPRTWGKKERVPGRMERAGRKVEELGGKARAAMGRGYDKSKDLGRRGVAKTRAAAGAVGRHLKRQKGRYGKAGLLAGLTAGGYAYARKDR